MVVGVCRITLLIHDNHSLKGKRQVLKSLIEKVKNRFNVSVAEVADNDMWQRAELGISAIGNDKSFVNGVLDKALDFIEAQHTAEVIGSEIELVNF